MGKNYQTLQFRCTTVRIGSFLAAVLMSVLMYIGSAHLRDTAQLVWRAVYLLVSFLCFSGGMVVVVPAAAEEEDIIVTNDNDTTASDVEVQTTPITTTDSPASSLCCNCCSCCNVFVLKSFYTLKAAKAQLWDGEDTLLFLLVLFFYFCFFWRLAFNRESGED